MLSIYIIYYMIVCIYNFKSCIKVYITVMQIPGSPQSQSSKQIRQHRPGTSSATSGGWEVSWHQGTVARGFPVERVLTWKTGLLGKTWRKPNNSIPGSEDIIHIQIIQWSSNTCFLPHGSWCGRVSVPEPLSFKVEWPMVSAEQKLEWILIDLIGMASTSSTRLGWCIFFRTYHHIS